MWQLAPQGDAPPAVCCICSLIRKAFQRLRGNHCLSPQFSSQAGFRFKIHCTVGLARRAPLHLTFHLSKHCQETGREENATELLTFFYKRVQRFVDCPGGAQLGNLAPDPQQLTSLVMSVSSYTTLIYRLCAIWLGQTSKNTCVWMLGYLPNGTSLQGGIETDGLAGR